MRTGNRLLTFFAAVLALGWAASLATPAAAEEFKLFLDPIVVEDLYTDVDTDSSRFEEYRDLESGLRIPRLKMDGNGGDRTLELRLTNVDREDGRYQLAYGVAGRYDFWVDYNKIPHRFGNNGRLLWTATSPGVFAIADPVQQAIQDEVAAQFALLPSGVSFAFLDAVLAPYLDTASQVDLGLRRDRAFAKVELGKGGAFSWGLETLHENREGNRPYGAAFGFNNVTEVPEPIDYETSGATLRGQWTGKGGALNFGYRRSRFENHVSTLFWDNPFRAVDGTDGAAYLGPSSSSVNGSSQGFADLAPDNDATEFFLSGRWGLGGDWYLQGGASSIQMEQDEPLLAYTLNSAIVGIDFDGSTFDPTDPANLPVGNADLEVDVRSLNADLGTRFGEDVTFVLRYRYYDYDNGSARVELPGYVRYHAVWEEVPRITVPSSYTRDSVGAELGWEIGEHTHLGLAYTLETWDRTFREVDRSDEDVLRLTFDTQPSRKWSLRAAYELGDRSIDEYRVEAQEASFLEPEGINNQPTLRKSDEAAREYDGADVQLQWFVTDAFNVFLSASRRDDDYDESEFGLLSDQLAEYNVELCYTPGAKGSFYVFYTLQDREVFQRARQSGGTLSTNTRDDWSVALEEGNDSWGLGWTGTWSERWTTDVSLVSNKSDGDADFTATAGGLPLGTARTEATDFDNYEDIELTAARFKVDYRLSDTIGVGVWYRYEDYTIDSFILQALDFYLPGALLLNASQGDYTSNLLAAQLKFRF